MNKPEQLPGEEQQTRPVFVSYATADRKEALSVCKAIERRGTRCWISSRDVKPGENYQEAIVRSIRTARAMVLVFSDAANNSDEIKKELSLASKHKLPVLALRIEDVEPSDAFAYELSTRQWIDAFEGWDRSIDLLSQQLGQVSTTNDVGGGECHRPIRRARVSSFPTRTLIIAAAVVLVVVASLGAWLLVRPTAATAHTMEVRLTGFQRLSPDLPQTLPDAVRDEIIAAFSDDGVIGVSTASAPRPGSAPAYALGGTIRRDGDKIRVITRLSNERSGTTLWSNTYSYDLADLSRVPRHIAVDSGSMARCGLFAASTYPKPLPDPVFSDYLQVCRTLNFGIAPTKGLDFARKVVAAAPDFSWGWSGLEIAALSASLHNESGAGTTDFRNEGLKAADTAVRLDPTNSEAMAFKSLLVDPANLGARESLLKRALAARALACGCEHHIYGVFLAEVGRKNAAVEQFRRSTDVLALDFDSQLALGQGLLETGRPEEAQPHLDAAVDLSIDPTAREQLTAQLAPLTHDYAGAVKAVADPKLPAPAAFRAPILAAFRALQSNAPAGRAKAAQQLAAMPPSNGELTVNLLALLGAPRLALKYVEDAAAARRFSARSWLFLPSMAAARSDPAFPEVAQRLGLIRYWRESKTRPDFCAAADAPAVCRMI